VTTFVAVENPAGLLGFKQRGVLTDDNPLYDFPATYEQNVAKNAKESKVAVYAERHKYFLSRKPDWAKENIAVDLLSDALDNRATVVKLLKQIKTDPDARALMCSSVNSLAKYIDNYCQANPGTTIDTLIVFGHGGADSMNVGLGRIGGIGNAALEDAKEDEQERASLMRIRGMAGLEARKDSAKPARIREIAFDNKDRWPAAFAALNGHAQARNDTGYFHLFLLACKVGAGPAQPPHRMFVNVAAKCLSAALGQEVAVAAPKKSITDSELFFILKNRPVVCNAVADANGSEVTLDGTAFATGVS
jgi:hypothetical protein